MTLRTTLVSRAVRLLPLAALVAAGGCFATRNDVRVVQADLANVRTEMLKSSAEHKEALAQAMRLLASSNDSVKAMSNRMTGLSGDVRAGLRTVNEQLILVQQLLKQNEQVIDRIRRQADQPTYVPPTTSPVGGATGDSVPPSASPQSSAGQLYNTAQSQFTRGSFSTARMGFQQMLDQYPTSPDAPAAQLGIARSFEGERNLLAAKTAYGAVISKYPDASQSAIAHYKLALMLINENKSAEAVPHLQAIIDKFKTSNEYQLAVDQLAQIKRPE